MKRMRRGFCAVAVLLTVVTLQGQTVNRAGQRLTGEKQAFHVLNRLTFGARPGDVAEVQRLGIGKWIDLQLHPDQIPENPVLESKLKTIEASILPTWQILEKYTVMRVAPRPAVETLLSPEQMRMLANGDSPEVSRAVMASLAPNVRREVLATVPPAVLERFPEFREEAAMARQALQAESAGARRPPPPNELLSPEQLRIARNGADEDKLELFNSFTPEKRKDVLSSMGPQAFPAGLPQLRREAFAVRNQPLQIVNEEMIQNKLDRAIYSNRQLEEVLVDFWMNHFNVFAGKNQIIFLLPSYERDAIRPHVLGHFKDLLLATARHPAMLIYLDNAQSQVPRDDMPQFAPDGTPLRRPGINENYGRELMELHTLGVDGGYTQADVIAVARAFTGWTVYDPQRYAEFQFNPAGHDRKEKSILGHTLPPGRGEQDGLDVIDILSHHPSTAKFISKKLAQRFVDDSPPQALIDRMAATFTKTDGDLRAVLQTLFTSPEFLSETAWQSKVKSPLEAVVSAARAVNADVVDTLILGQRIAELGEPLYGKVEPTGYPNTGEGWTGAGSVLGRINFATALTAGQIPGVKADVSRFNFKLPAVVAAELLGTPPSPATLQAIEKAIQGKEATPSLLAGLALGSPEFQRR